MTGFAIPWPPLEARTHGQPWKQPACSPVIPSGCDAAARRSQPPRAWRGSRLRFVTAIPAGFVAIDWCGDAAERRPHTPCGGFVFAAKKFAAPKRGPSSWTGSPASPGRLAKTWRHCQRDSSVIGNVELPVMHDGKRTGFRAQGPSMPPCCHGNPTSAKSLNGFILAG